MTPEEGWDFQGETNLSWSEEKMADLDSDVLKILRSVHGAKEPPKRKVRFDKDAFLKVLNASIQEQMPRLTDSGRSALYVYSGNLDLLTIARGIAAASTRPAQIVELVSDDLKRGDAGILVRPILSGQVLILVHSGSSEIPARMAECWPEFCRNPSGCVAPITWGLTFNSLLKPDPAGVIVVLQTAHAARTRTIDEWPLIETDAAELAALADRFDSPVLRVGRSPGELAPLRDNQHAYREYWDLIHTVRDAGHDTQKAESILRSVIRGADVAELQPDFLYHGIGLELYEQLFDRLLVLSRHCQKISGGFRKESPLPDVYAAALSICASWKDSRPNRTVVYRGQRNREWKVIPSFFRPNADGSPADRTARERRLALFVNLMRKANPELDETQCVAAAQHVSKEARTPTWMIDVTWDPLVALYFASSGGQAEEIGVVDQIVLAEWKKYVASRPEYQGGFILCEAPGIERLRRQRGGFLNAPHPDIYDRYVPHRRWFCQQPGLTFTDPRPESPISDEWLLPRERDLEKIISRLDRSRAKPKPPSGLPPDPTVQLGPRHLWDTLREREGVAKLDDFHRFVLDTVCEVHSRADEWAENRDPVKFSLHRLDEVILRLLQFQRTGKRCHLEEAVGWSRSRLSDQEFGALLNLGSRIWMERYPIPLAVVLEETTNFIEEVRLIAPTVGGVTIPGPAPMSIW